MLTSVQHLLIPKSPLLKLQSFAPQMTIAMLVGAAGWWLISSASYLPDESKELPVVEQGSIASRQAESTSAEDLSTVGMLDCYECYMTLSLSLDPSCERLITADLLLKSNALALSNPEYYQVRLTVGKGPIIADNTLKIQHVGKDITAMVSYIGPPPCPQGLACMTSISLKNDQEVNLEAQALLDQALGGYQKAWIGPANQLVDLAGNVIDPQISFADRGICVCNPAVVQVRYYNLDSMKYLTKDSIVMICETTEETQMINQGIIAVNCNNNTYCTQDFTYALDECGLGTITREFRIWKSCWNEVSDTIKKTQIITLVNTCDLNKYMFDLPQDTVINGCTPVFDPLGSGNVVGDADPNRTGEPVYTFEKDCRIIAIAHDDKVSTLLLPTGQCYAIIRTWYLADWCVIGSQPNWWQQPGLVVDSFTQIIVLLDTIAPTYEIEIEGLINDTVSVGTCPRGDLNGFFYTFDTCGTKNYKFSLDTLSDPPETRYSGATVLIGDIRDTMILNIPNVIPGHYQLIVTIEDHCGNEGECIDTFIVTCDVNRQAGMVEHHLEQPTVLSSNPEKTALFEEVNDPTHLKLPSTETVFELYQNRPNPFRTSTVVGFYLPQADEARLTIFDVQGRRLKIIEGPYAKGYNEIELKAIELQVTGVLYYQLETTGYTATRRMIVTL